jgi:hypothetical protein
MPDGILSIGAIFEKARLEGDFAEASEAVQAAMDDMSMSFESSRKKTREAAEAMRASIQSFGKEATAASLQAAEGFKAVALAQDHVRASTVLMKDSTVDATYATLAMAASQKELAAAQALQAERQAALAAETAAAAKEAALSSNWIVRGFQEAAAAVTESCTVMQEKLVQTAETGKLSAEGMTAGFAGLGSLLGAGIVVGFGAHFMDELAKINVELDHLHVETGINITNLAGLQQIVKSMGADWDPIAVGLNRMNKNLNDAMPPTKQLEEALAGVGLKFEEFQGLTAEDKLQKIAIAFAGTTNEANRTAAAYALFGRGGVALIPVLSEQGEQLEANMKKLGELTGMTEASAAAARRWTQDVAKLSADFRSVMIPVLENVEDVIGGMVGVWDTAAASMVTAFEAIPASIFAVGHAAQGLGRILQDLAVGNWGALGADVTQMKNSMLHDFSDISTSWKQVYSDFTGVDMEAINGKIESLSRSDLRSKFKPPLAPDLGDDKNKKKVGGRTSGVLSADLEALNALKLDHEVTLEEEISFWQSRLAAATKGTEAYRAILEKLAPLMQRELKKPQDKGDQRSVDLSGITIPEDALNRAVKANSDAVKQTVDADRFGAEEKMRIAAEEYRDVEENTAFEVRMGRMSAEQRLQILRQAALQENRIRQEQSRFVQLLDMNDSRRYMQDLMRQEQAGREFARRMTEINRQAPLDFVNKWNQAMRSFNQGFRRVIEETLIGTKSIGQGFAQMFNGIIVGLADMVAQWLLKEAEKWAMLHVMQALGIGQQKATQAAANVTTVTSDAAVAAAGALAFYSAINPPAAPALAAAQFAMTMAYAPMAAFAQGGVVNGQRGMGVPILAHAGERVLTPGQTENFHKLVNQTTNSASSSSKMELHLQQNVHAYDRSGMRNTLRAHADDLMDIVQQGVREGKLKYA